MSTKLLPNASMNFGSPGDLLSEQTEEINKRIMLIVEDKQIKPININRLGASLVTFHNMVVIEKKVQSMLACIGHECKS